MLWSKQDHWKLANKCIWNVGILFHFLWTTKGVADTLSMVMSVFCSQWFMKRYMLLQYVLIHSLVINHQVIKWPELAVIRLALAFFCVGKLNSDSSHLFEVWNPDSKLSSPIWLYRCLLSMGVVREIISSETQVSSFEQEMVSNGGLTFYMPICLIYLIVNYLALCA